MGSQSVGSTLMSLTNGMSEIFFLKKSIVSVLNMQKLFLSDDYLN